MKIQTGLKGFTIRPAVVSDTALILSFINELAEYEKLQHEVVATETSLRESLFGVSVTIPLPGSDSRRHP